MFGQLQHQHATRRQLHQYALYAGATLSHQGFDKRFNAAGAAFLEALLGQCLQREVVGLLPPLKGLVGSFQGVYLVDSTDLGNGQKLMTRLNLHTGQLHIEQVATSRHDNGIPLAQAELPTGALRLADLGFYDLASFDQYDAAGVFWITRYKVNTRLYLPQETTPLDLPVFLHAHDQLYLPVRFAHYPHLNLFLVAPSVATQRQTRQRDRAKRKAQPVSQRGLDLAHWELYLTNIPYLTVSEILALAHTRWQIELVFKLWKSELALTHIQSQDPLRQRCLFLAKLIALWLTHTLMALNPQPNRSWWQALYSLRLHLPMALTALAAPHLWLSFLQGLAHHLYHASPMSKRKKAPLTFQALGAFP